jgi:hypothetical protein
METVTEEGSDDGYLTAEDGIPQPKDEPKVGPDDLTNLTSYQSCASPKYPREELKDI